MMYSGECKSRSAFDGGVLGFDRVTSTEVDNSSEKMLKLNNVNANDEMFALAA
jgi:hypothetical protein